MQCTASSFAILSYIFSHKYLETNIHKFTMHAFESNDKYFIFYPLGRCVRFVFHIRVHLCCMDGWPPHSTLYNSSGYPFSTILLYINPPHPFQGIYLSHALYNKWKASVWWCSNDLPLLFRNETKTIRTLLKCGCIHKFFQ